MRKSKILGIALAAAMVSSFAAVSVSAVTEASELKDHVVGITGAFCNWGTDAATGAAIPDVVMTDDDGDGVYEADIAIPEVTQDMIAKQTTDTGVNGVVETGKEGVTFKIRLDNAWMDTGNWGAYEVAFNRTENSQTDFCAECSVGDNVIIHVKFDTNTIAEQEGLTPDDDDYITIGSGDEHLLWPATFTVEKVGGATEDPASEEPASEEPASEEPASEEPASEEPASEEPASEEPASEAPASEAPASEAPASEAPATDKDGNASTVATGDTTSAVALVAVVIASLGAAVVMTKKASKE